MLHFFVCLYSFPIYSVFEKSWNTPRLTFLDFCFCYGKQKTEAAKNVEFKINAQL